MRKTGALLIIVAALAIANLLQFQAGRQRNRQLDDATREILRLRQELAEAAPRPGPGAATSGSDAATQEVQAQVQQLESEVLRLRGVANRGLQAEAELANLKAKGAPPTAATSANANTAASAPQAEPLNTYLGEPVPPPPNLSPAYTREGLLNAVQQAARDAGVSPRKINIDISEFPYLAGVICNDDAEFERLKEQFKKTADYEYTGSVSSHGVYAFTLVPHRAFPPESSERISRRTTIRQRMLFDQLNSGQTKD